MIQAITMQYISNVILHSKCRRVSAYLTVNISETVSYFQ